MHGVASGRGVGDFMGALFDLGSIMSDKLGAEAGRVETDGALDAIAANCKISSVVAAFAVAGGGDVAAVTERQKTEVTISKTLERCGRGVGRNSVVVPVGESGGAADDDVDIAGQDVAVDSGESEEAIVEFEAADVVGHEPLVFGDKVEELAPFGCGS